MNNNIFFRAAHIAAAVAAALVAGQASAHVSYGRALYDDSAVAGEPKEVTCSGVPRTITPTVAETKYMRLSDCNKGALSTQDTTVSSNTGFIQSRNTTLWANSHDNKFFWFSISKPTKIHVKITGKENAPYTSAVAGSSLNGIPQAISTLKPAFALFQGAMPRSAHDGAYSPYNTGFAAWSSWGQMAIPAGQTTMEGDTKYVTTGNLNAQGNPVYGRAYTTDIVCNPPDITTNCVPNNIGEAGAPANIAAGMTEHMGIYGGWWLPGTGPLGEAGFWAANNKGTKNQDGTDAASSYAFLKYVTYRTTTGNVLETDINLTQPGVYSLVVGGNGVGDARRLVSDAKLTGMGPEGCATDPSLPSFVCLNGSPATVKAMSTNAKTKASGIGDWDRYRNVDRGARAFTIELTGTPK